MTTLHAVVEVGCVLIVLGAALLVWALHGGETLDRILADYGTDDDDLMELADGLHDEPEIYDPAYLDAVDAAWLDDTARGERS